MPKQDMVVQREFVVAPKKQAQSAGFHPQKNQTSPVVDLGGEFESAKSSGPQSSSGDFGRVAMVEKGKMQRESRFQNRELEEKTQALQDEFERIMGELNQRRVNKNGEAFYEAIHEYY